MHDTVWLSISSSRPKHLQNVQNARSRAVRVHGEPLAAPERAGQVRATHTAWCCVLPCSERSRATSACLRNVPSPVRLQRPIPCMSAPRHARSACAGAGSRARGVRAHMRIARRATCPDARPIRTVCNSVAAARCNPDGHPHHGRCARMRSHRRKNSGLKRPSGGGARESQPETLFHPQI